ncbi:MAG: hypothetical protein V3T72_20315, partial [Thermoanaerobaculia bacterium]
ERLRAFEPLLAAVRPSWWTPERAAILAARSEFIRSWDQVTDEELDDRLRLLETHKERLRELGDTRFAELLRERASAAKNARVQAWDLDLEMIGNLGIRLQHIRTLLGSLDSEGDGEQQRIARRFLARRIISSILELEENPTTRQALAALTPEVAELEGRSVRFDLVYQKLQGFDSLADYQGLARRLDPLISTAENLVRERRLMPQSTRAVLFEDVSGAGRNELWRELIDELERRYLFQTSAEARVEGLQPLPEVLSDWLAAEAGSQQTHQRLLEELTTRPIYHRELEVAEALIRKRVFGYRVVRTYRDFWTRLKANHFPFATLPTSPLQALLDELPTSGVYKEELEGILASVESFNERPTYDNKERVEAQVHRVLERLCLRVLEGHSGDCAGVS